MSPIDLLLHLANFLLPPLAVAAILVLLAKGLVWRALLAKVPWRSLWLQCAGLGLLGQLGALLWFGVEGKLAGYALWLGLLSLPLAWRLVR